MADDRALDCTNCGYKSWQHLGEERRCPGQSTYYPPTKEEFIVSRYSEKECREEFEKKAIEWFCTFETHESGEYKDHRTFYIWSGWKEAWRFLGK